MNPVVIDTNCLLQIISRKSPYRPIWDAFIAGRFDLCVSNEILDEYQEILEQQITPTVAENLVMMLLNQQNVRLVDPYFRMGMPFPQLNLVTLDEFLKTRLIEGQ